MVVHTPVKDINNMMIKLRYIGVSEINYEKLILKKGR